MIVIDVLSYVPPAFLAFGFIYAFVTTKPEA